jgi:hypothetical protein
MDVLVAGEAGAVGRRLVPQRHLGPLADVRSLLSRARQPLDE